MSKPVDSEEELEKQLSEIILSRLGSEYSVAIAGYADYVEYGRKGPVTKQESDAPKVDDADSSGKVLVDKKGNTEKVTQARMNIRNWVQVKYGMNEHDRKTYGDMMYERLMNNSIPPHPFIRPAIRDAEQATTEDIVEFGNKMGATEFAQAYAEYLAERMRQHLKENGSVVTKGLINSIEVKRSIELPPNTKKFQYREE